MIIITLPDTVTSESKPIKIGNTDTATLEVRPSGIFTGGTPTSSSGTAANAFDNDIAISCDCTAEVSTITYQLTSAKTAKGFSICCDANNGSLEDFTFRGSNNGADWDTLETISTVWAVAGWKNFTLGTTGDYLYYRVDITGTQADANAKLFEVEAYESLIAGMVAVDVKQYQSEEFLSPGTGDWIILNYRPRVIENIGFDEFKTDRDYEESVGSFRPIYTKTIDCGNMPDSTTSSSAHNIANVSEFVNFTVVARDGFDVKHLPWIWVGSEMSFSIDATNFHLYSEDNRASFVCAASIEYTKTTDTATNKPRFN